MSEIIDWKSYNDNDHILAWFLVEAVGAKGAESIPDFDPSNLEISLQVNGVEVSIVEHFEYLQGQLDDMYRKGIQEGKEDAVASIQNLISDKILNNEEKDFG